MCPWSTNIVRQIKLTICISGRSNIFLVQIVHRRARLAAQRTGGTRFATRTATSVAGSATAFPPAPVRPHATNVPATLTCSIPRTENSSAPSPRRHSCMIHGSLLAAIISTCITYTSTIRIWWNVLLQDHIAMVLNFFLITLDLMIIPLVPVVDRRFLKEIETKKRICILFSRFQMVQRSLFFFSLFLGISLSSPVSGHFFYLPYEISK
jgi:hypothetical protein